MNTTAIANVERMTLSDNVGIYLGTKTDSGLLVYQPVAFTQEYHEPATMMSPTFYLDDGIARALMEALVNHYDFNLDTSTARKDYLYERARVDTLTAAILDMLRSRA